MLEAASRHLPAVLARTGGRQLGPESLRDLLGEREQHLLLRPEVTVERAARAHRPADDLLHADRVIATLAEELDRGPYDRVAKGRLLSLSQISHLAPGE